MTLNLVQKDSRGRVALGSVLTDEQYIVTTHTGGIVILEPAVIMTRADFELRSQPQLLEKVEHSIAHPETLTTHKR